jgi:hypothetical protein
MDLKKYAGLFCIQGYWDKERWCFLRIRKKKCTFEEYSEMIHYLVDIKVKDGTHVES